MIEIIFALLVSYVALTLGHFVFRKMNINTGNGEKLVYSAALGFAILAYLVFFLGLAGLLYNWLFFIILGSLGIVLAGEFIKSREKLNFQI